MKVLIVIPVFNRQDIITKTLNSIVNQTRKADAVLVVNDGSTDNTEAVISEWINANRQIQAHLITTKNSGASAARNRAVEMMGSGMDYVAFLDSDDVWPTDFLERACDALSKNTQAVAVSTDRKFCDTDGSERRISTLTGITKNPWLWMVKNGGGIGSCTLFRMSAVNRAGRYPEDIPTGHDSVLFGRIATMGPWIRLAGKPTVFMRSKTGNKKHHLHSRYSDYRTWWAKSSQMCWDSAPHELRVKKEANIYLSERWRNAAKSALERLQFDEAEHCLHQSITNRPFDISSRALMVKLFFARKRHENRYKHSY